ncbi:MAG: hypothetical protein MZV64_29585 [Ignavibacteriales bacterium]|nr:hypothetical protein [Ignavibacteriales bacterium]
MEESIARLRREGRPDLMEVTTALAGTMVWLGGKASSIEEGMRVALSSIWSGAAYEKFCAIVRAQGGDVNVVEDPSRYPISAHRIEVPSPAGGFIAGFATKRIGMAAVDLGAGRRIHRRSDRLTRGDPRQKETRGSRRRESRSLRCAGTTGCASRPQ